MTRGGTNSAGRRPPGRGGGVGRPWLTSTAQSWLLSLRTRGPRDPLGGEDDLPAVRRPGGVVPEAGEPADGLARGPHEEQAAALAFRAEGDLLAVG